MSQVSWLSRLYGLVLRHLLEATWEEPFPKPDEPQYESFIEAYRTFLRFKGIALPRPSIAQMAALDKPRPSGSFEALKDQPDFITNGKLMDFQLEGVSWLVSQAWAI
jgi:hypothetical protein